MEMKEQDYMSQRVDDQINWLEGKSAFNQQRYKFSKSIVIVASVSIPFMAGFIEDGDQATVMKFAIAFAGFIIALAEGLSSLHKFHENWIQYRGTAESLKREKIIFLTQSGIYRDNPNAFRDFVVAIEGILANENAKWQEITANEVVIEK
ncbi:MAG: DUF4231 domain-containing protein [Saprospiraceae bacterium]|jgi:hypothetical protein|nr:DUF4231 domain-containing protein [Saprospiraceae bacterium]MDP5000179.1 DUF4231 domain-containing protein [Saprospiraceae bacterium]